jgi:hypothetical protein
LSKFIGKIFKKEDTNKEDKKVDRNELKHKQKRLFLLTDGEVDNPD